MYTVNSSHKICLWLSGKPGTLKGNKAYKTIHIKPLHNSIQNKSM